MFREILAAINGHQPREILVDFEQGAINAIDAVFPNAITNGCVYHLCSNIWKNIQRHGLQVQYGADEELGLHLRMLSALAFLPPQDVVEGFDTLCAEIRGRFEDLADVLEYFEDTYVGHFQHNAPRWRPMFPNELWNMFERTHKELPRTNNNVEGCVSSTFSACHPNFWRFIGVLKREESVVRVGILQELGGHPPPPQRRRYADSAARILCRRLCKSPDNSIPTSHWT